MYRVRTQISGWQGGPGLQTSYFDDAGLANGADALAAVNRVRGAWDVVKSILPSTVTAQTLGQVDVIDVPSGGLTNSLGVTQPAIVVGTGGAVPGPAQVAGGIQLLTQTFISGRRLRGHINISPLQQASVNILAPSVGTMNALAAMGVALVTISPPAVPPLVVWRRPIPGRAGGMGAVTTSAAATKWFSLRSRRD